MDESHLFEVQTCANVFVDACVRNTSGALMFMSAYGRDTAIKELMARIQLGASHREGLTSLTLQNAHAVHKVEVGDVKSLTKTTGRLPKCVFGDLNHLWLYQPQVKGISKGAGSAWILVKNQEPQETTQSRVWSAITQISSIALLPSWQSRVMEVIGESMVTDYKDARRVNPRMAIPIGFHQVFEVHVNQKALATLVSSLVASGELTLDESPTVQMD